jgi:hypothetical protein
MLSFSDDIWYADSLLDFQHSFSLSFSLAEAENHEKEKKKKKSLERSTDPRGSQAGVGLLIHAGLRPKTHAGLKPAWVSRPTRVTTL